jgi:hypothetical protein
VVEALSAVPFFPVLEPCLREIIDCWSDDLAAEQGGIAALEALAAGTGGALHRALGLLAHDGNVDQSALDASGRAGTAWSLLASARGLEAELAGNAAVPEGGTEEDRDARLQGLLREIAGRAGHHLLASRAQNVGGRGKHMGCSINAISARYLKALEKSDFQPQAFFGRQPGNMAKLMALMGYHFF